MNKLLTAFGAFLISSCICAQLSVQQLNKTTVITFDQTTDGINNGAFSGSGFSPSPEPGQLNSKGIIVRGTSEGDLDFGDSNNKKDFARGLSTGNKTTGGIYAFEIADTDVAIGVQPTREDMSPGDIIIKLTNNTGFDTKTIEISYDIYELNNEDRSSSIILSTSFDQTNFSHHSSLDYFTTKLRSDNPQWIKQNQSFNQDITLSNNSEYYLKFTFDDNGGSGSRDEIAIDNISICLNPGSTNISHSVVANFHIHPNPAQRAITVYSSLLIKNIELYNTAGTKVKQIRGVTNSRFIPVNDLRKGIYIVKVTYTNGIVGTKKLVIP
ncbi:T9SS type A sorting domain-containing protein [Carboxylicivirga sp. RSCT41]|uniref:T9SS type A sorting domain-containing protein n=1 Tax=Carboxylicivirga agarovorans TaxID=3417570 RepID=UPI003D3486CF